MSEPEPPPAVGAARVPPGPPVLSYRPPLEDSERRTSGRAVVAGLGAAAGVCAGGCVVFGATARDTPAGVKIACLLTVAAVLAALITAAARLRRQAGWRGFGLCVAIGLAVGLLALVPCAGLYVVYGF